jgi:hypothetical protein
MTVREWLNEEVEEVLVADGLDDALLGYAHRVGQPPVAVYDAKKCIEVLMQTGPMTEDEAQEYFDFNVVGSWVGAGTPCFLIRPDVEVKP